METLPCPRRSTLCRINGIHSSWCGVHPDAAGRLWPLLPYSSGYAEPFVISQARRPLLSWDFARAGSFALNALPHPDLLTRCSPCPFCGAFFTHSVMLSLPESKHLINIHLPLGFPPWGLQTHLAKQQARLLSGGPQNIHQLSSLSLLRVVGSTDWSCWGRVISHCSWC